MTPLFLFFSISHSILRQKKLEAKQLPPPFRPLTEDERDCQNFDVVFTEEFLDWTPVDE